MTFDKLIEYPKSESKMKVWLSEVLWVFLRIWKDLFDSLLNFAFERLVVCLLVVCQLQIWAFSI